MTSRPRGSIPLLFCLLIFVVAPAQGTTGIPDMSQSTIGTRATVEVSVMICPACDGPPFTEAQLFGGGTMDATIEVIMRDFDGNPIPGLPYVDFWLMSSELCFCPLGNVADFDTDVNGYTEFANPLCGGGCSENPTLEGYFAGMAFHQNPIPHIKINSPDMNCDLVVNLIDLGLFASAYHSGYSYCADFNFNGELNLSDVAIFAQHYGHTCHP